MQKDPHQKARRAPLEAGPEYGVRQKQIFRPYALRSGGIKNSKDTSNNVVSASSAGKLCKERAYCRSKGPTVTGIPRSPIDEEGAQGASPKPCSPERSKKLAPQLSQYTSTCRTVCHLAPRQSSVSTLPRGSASPSSWTSRSPPTSCQPSPQWGRSTLPCPSPFP